MRDPIQHHRALDSSELLITADAHVNEPDDLNERLPANLRQYGLKFSNDPGGTFDMDIEGYTFRAEVVEPPSEIERAKEFRSDPTGGRDLSVRLRDMAIEGVDAQVIFPNGGLLVGSGAAPPEFRIAFASAYNDWAWENFSADRDRYCVAAMIPTESVAAAVSEAKRLSLKPSEFFLRQGHVTITDDPVALNNIAFTGADCILWGNDYPHDEGTFPLSQRFIDDIRAALSEEDTQKVLSKNAARLFGFDLERLAARKSELSQAA